MPVVVRRSDGAWGRLAGALAVLGLVVIGIPALLVVCSRAGIGSASPVPALGSADEIRTFFERQLTTTEIVPIAVRALLIVAWLLWAGLVSSVVVALLQATGHRAVGLPRLAMFSGLARWIAAGLAAAATLTPSVAVGDADGASAGVLARRQPRPADRHAQHAGGAAPGGVGLRTRPSR